MDLGIVDPSTKVADRRMNKIFRLPMTTVFYQNLLALSLGAGVVLGLGACSVDNSGEHSQELSLASVAPTVLAQAPGAEKTRSANDPCQPDELAAFDRTEGEEFDLEREVLPRGLYLATISEMLLEKKGEPPTRMLIREIPGGKQQGEVLCAENLDRLGDSFDLSLSGVVKFETMTDTRGADLTLRQFTVFSSAKGHGAVITNPKLASRDKTLKSTLTSPLSSGQLSRIDDRHFMLKFIRERDGVRARLQIRLELIPQN
jgi:hypothetical protein